MSISATSALAAVDPEICAILNAELRRQQEGIELIASENFASPAVMAAMGSILTNKYAEGYPGKRYYGGCEEVDRAEQLAIDRARSLFGAEHANVQPHSGSQANLAAYLALINPGDTILGMDLNHGGHLTHGHKVNFSGKLFHVVSYGVSKHDERLDYAEVRRLALEAKPRLIITGASAYPRQWDFAKFREIADEVGAYLLADMAHFAGLVAAELHPNPTPYCDAVTSTTHKTLRGPRAGFILCKAEHAKKIDAAVFPGSQGGPLMHIIAAKAVCFHEAAQPAFRDYCRRVLENASAMAEAFLSRGYRLVSGGTDNHLMLVDVRGKGLTGKEAETAIGLAGITVNKNQIPFDTNPPTKSSGIRVGTPAVTTRGMGPGEMKILVDIMDQALSNPRDLDRLRQLAQQTREIASAFPLYPEITY